MEDKKDKLGIPEIEERISDFWDSKDIFKKSLEKTKDGEPFAFYDGPPFATGLPHYGHILASTIKDVVPRYQTMRGRFVRRRWGWDCHGLPIEALVEQKLEISGKKQIEEVGVKKFNETCRSLVLRFADEWGRMVRRMGRWVDFDNSYKTMDRDYMESVWWAFKQVHEKGLAYEGRKVLLYCPRCETPISNFEVAMDNSYKEVTEESVFVKFKIKEEVSLGAEKVGGSDRSAYFLAWTTTPWTLPGNVALAVGADIDYVLVRSGEELYVLAAALVAKVLPEGFEQLAEFKGSEIVGAAYEPLFAVGEVAASERSYKVYGADFVTTEDGTGIVHTAVVYGEDDYQLGLREDLPVVPLLDEKGHFQDAAPELIRGQYFKKAEKSIKVDLEARGLLLSRQSYTHSYPHCWRCGTSLFYNAIPAWFINVQDIKGKLLETNNSQINWFPEHLKHGRYEKSVEAAPDWNISRNRYWGNPIPAWRCEDCEKIEVVGSLEELGSRSIKKNEILFVRHGETTNLVEGYCSPGRDTDEYTSRLTEKGQAQIEAAAKVISEKNIDLIVSSPLHRMRETVEIIKKHVDVPVEFMEELRDLDHGRLVKHSEWLEALEGQDSFTFSLAGGESQEDVRVRMAKALRLINEKYEGKKILVATHGDPILLTRSILCGVPSKDISNLPYPETGQVYEFEWSSLPFNDRGEVDLHRPYIDEVLLRCDCGGSMRRTPEIFDSWVEAGSMPFSEYHYPFENKEVFESRFPAQFVAEYIAQTRAWFYVMHVMSQIIFGRAPFENVVTTGTILAEDGSKMSKSKQNYPDPWVVIDKYGVDSLRFYLMNSVVMQADNLNFSEKDLQTIHRKVTMILWNVHQYFLTYSSERSVGSVAGPREPWAESLDAWIGVRSKELVLEVTARLDAYDTVRATRFIVDFIDDLSTWYLRRSRGREDAEFFSVLREILMMTSKVLAPFMPHLSEAVYQDLRLDEDPESVHLVDWPLVADLSDQESELLESMSKIREAASAASAARKAAGLPVRQPLARMHIRNQEGEAVEFSPALEEILLSELNIKKMDVLNPKDSGVVSSEGVAGSGRFLAYLDTELDAELRLEGLTRNLERSIQGQRKDLGLKVGEAARLIYSEKDAGTEHESAVRGVDTKKTYLGEVVAGDVPPGEFKVERM